MSETTVGHLPAAPPVTAVRGRLRLRELSWPDWLFLTVFLLTVSYSLLVLISGALSALALPTGWHDSLHVRGMSTGIVGRAAEAVADAAHRTQPGLQLAIDYVFSLFNVALAGLLAWLRPRDWAARLLALAMVGTAAVFNLQAYGVYEALATTRIDALAHDIFHLLAAVAYSLALLLFPDGRLVPRWRRLHLLLLYVPAVVALAAVALQIEGTSRTLILIMIFGIVTPAIGVASQAYRYRRSPSPVQRQQARLLFWALTPALLLSIFVLAGGLTESAFGDFQGRQITVLPVALFRVFQPIFLLIPVALFVGILHFRLWDIDRVISRALVYGALAGFVSLVYIGVVVGVGQMIGAQSSNVLLSIAATGIVAVAFEPVKARVQRQADRLVYGRRSTPYEILSSFSKGMAETIVTEEKLSRLAQVLAEGTTAVRADVWLTVGEEMRLAASWPNHRTDAPPPAVRVEGAELPSLGTATAAVPVRHESELLGALSVTKPPNETLSPMEGKLITDLSAHAGLLLRNVRLTAELLDRLKELRASRQRLVAAQDEARRRLERNLHDGAQQELVSLKVRLSLAQRMAEQGKPVAELLQQLGVHTGEAIDNLRDLARGIYPPLLAAEGLPAAMQAQARKTPLPVTVEAQGIGRYHQDVEAAVYFCCLEALQNINKYASATQASITLREEAGKLLFTVTDNGLGFDRNGTTKGAGLTNMADRIDALDGTLEITSAPGAGTTLSGSIPAAAQVK